MALKVDSALSGMTVMASTVLGQAFRISALLVLARLLDPDDFGLARLGLVVVGAGQLVASLGMNAAVVASEAGSIRAAYYAGRMTAGGGIVFMGGIIALGPVVAGALGAEELGPILQCMAVLMLFQTLTVVPEAFLMKEMRFGRLVVARTMVPLCYMVVAIPLAYGGYGVWSLVVGQVMSGAAGFGGVLLMCPSLEWLRPGKWDSGVAREMAKYGTVHMGTGAVRYGYSHGDAFMVGHVLGANALGFYSQAYNLCNIPIEVVSRVANTVLFPAYAKIRNDRVRLAKAFLDSFEVVAVLSVPMAVGLLVLGPDLVIFLVGEKWLGTIPVLQVLSVLGIVRPLSGSTGSLFLALKRPDFNLRTAILQCAAMFILVSAVLSRGIVMVAGAVVAAFMFGLIYNLYLACARTGLAMRIGDICGRLVPAIVASGIMAMMIACLRILVLDSGPKSNTAVSLGVTVVGGGLAYLISLGVMRPGRFASMFKLGRDTVWRVGGIKGYKTKPRSRKQGTSD